MSMMLSKKPPAYDRGDIPGSLKAVNDYLTYLYENIDYQMGQLKRTGSESGAAAQEAAQQSGQTAQELSAVKSALTQLSAQLAEAVERLDADVAALEQQYTDLEGRVAALET